MTIMIHAITIDARNPSFFLLMSHAKCFSCFESHLHQFPLQRDSYLIHKGDSTIYLRDPRYNKLTVSVRPKSPACSSP